jgi:hypothetical protein
VLSKRLIRDFVNARPLAERFRHAGLSPLGFSSTHPALAAQMGLQRTGCLFCYLRRSTASSTKTATRIMRAISVSRSGAPLDGETMMVELDEGDKAALVAELKRTIAADLFQ